MSSLFGGPQRIKAPGRWLAWRGLQRPMLGVGLPAFDALRRASDAEGILASLLGGIELAGKVGASFVALPEGLGEETDRVVAQGAEAAGLACLLSSGGRGFCSAPEAASLCGLMASHDASDVRGLESCEEVHPALEEAGIPLVASGGQAHGQAGRVLRTAGCFADAILLRQPAGLAPAETMVSCLTMRSLGRPTILRVALEEGLDARRLAALVAGCCLAGLVLDLPEHGQDVTGLHAAAEALASLPGQLTEPRSEQAAVLYANEVTLAGALLLLQRGAGCDAALLTEVDRASRPSLLFVPAHGELDPDAWSYCWSQAQRGAHILVTGLCLGGGETATRLKRLGLPIQASSSRQRPPWLESRALFATGPGCVERAVGRGSLSFSERCLELEPSDPAALAVVAELAQRAEIPNDAWLSSSTSLRRAPRFPNGELRADLASGQLEWRTITAS